MAATTATTTTRRPSLGIERRGVLGARYHIPRCQLPMLVRGCSIKCVVLAISRVYVLIGLGGAWPAQLAWFVGFNFVV